MIALLFVAPALVALVIWKDALPLLARLVAVHEARYAKPSAPTDQPMPDALYALANAQGAEWARDDLLAAMREAYSECGDWSIVASRFHDGGREVNHMRIAL